MKKNIFRVIKNIQFPNKNLSIVVLTQKIRCNIIPKINKKILVLIKEIFKKLDIIKAPINVIITSAIAILKIR